MALKVKKDLAPELKKLLRQMEKQRVYVGIPAETAGRGDENGKPSELNNAEIGYLMEHGVPEKNVPARPFLEPGVRKQQARITAVLKAGAVKQFKEFASGKTPDLSATLSKVGQIGRDSVISTINAGVSPPLSPNTIKNRFRQRETKSRRKGEKNYLDLISSGTSPAEAEQQTGIKPLMNTLGLLKSITFVIRNGKR